MRLNYSCFASRLNLESLVCLVGCPRSEWLKSIDSLHLEASEIWNLSVNPSLKTLFHGCFVGISVG